MATKRKRGSAWHYQIKRGGLLPKPVYLSFPSEEEGDAYVERLERLLDQGIVPPDLVERQHAGVTITAACLDYLRAAPVSDADRPNLGVLMERLGEVKIGAITYPWVETWVSSMKRELNLAPSTIRHYVGALARLWDWCRRQGMVAGENPFRLLPRGYATYNEHDQVSLVDGGEVKEDEWRDVRLEPAWEVEIGKVLAGGYRRVMPSGKLSERPLALAYRESLYLLFHLALESAMRMSEMVTLELSQVDIARLTVFLDKTKNGDKRQVPMTSVAVEKLTRYLAVLNADGVEGFSAASGRLFPWWDGSGGKPALKKVIAALSRQYARIFEAAGCPEFRFHDLRHEATSRLFERTRLSDSEIAKITGHKDPRMLMRYANLRASHLASSLW